MAQAGRPVTELAKPSESQSLGDPEWRSSGDRRSLSRGVGRKKEGSAAHFSFASEAAGLTEGWKTERANLRHENPSCEWPMSLQASAPNATYV